MSSSVSVTPEALIDLRPAGERLGSPATRIKATQAGTYLSRYKGRGMEFEEHRLYQPGDDVRNIDWRVTARTGRPHTRVYREERERPVLFCIDYRRSMFFATRGAFKSVTAAKAAAILAWASNHHGDRVGGLVFSETRHMDIRPHRGKGAVLKLIRTLARAHSPPGPSDGPGLPLSRAMSRLRRVARPGALAVVISDFRGWDDRAETHLLQIARHATVWLVFVADPVEAELPRAGVYRVSDGSRAVVVDARSEAVRRAYAERFRRRHEHLGRLSRRYGMSLIPVSTDVDLPVVLRNELVARTAA